MGLLRKLLGVGVFCLGVFLALYPFTSTWRISGQVLDELPTVTGYEVTDTRNGFGTAIFDPDFTLATRTYQGAGLADVEAALVAHGFEGTVDPEKRGRIKGCCGQWDAVVVHLTDDPAEAPLGTVLAVVSVYDTDIQSTWGLLFLFGSLMAFGGLVILVVWTGADRVLTGPETVNA